MLSQFLISEVFTFLLVFCRLGSAFMMLPGFGESYVLSRARLMMALMFSLILVPTTPAIPIPVTIGGLITIMMAEILVGLFIGALSRMLIAAIHIGGMMISYQSSLISALVPEINQSQGQGTALGNLLSVSAVVLLFTTDLHHLMLRGLADSYLLFLPGQFPIVADMAEHASQLVNGAFRMALQLAAPHIVIGLMLYLASGIISRLMPNMQIFFIMMPPQLLLSFIILFLSISALLMWYMEYFQNSFALFVAPLA